MNVVVCVKQIPDPADPGALNPDHTLKRDGKLILDESDSYGVEMALQLVDAAGGGEVTLVSMAPNSEVSGCGGGAPRSIRYSGSTSASAPTSKGRMVLPRRRPKKASVDRLRRSAVIAIAGAMPRWRP